MRLHRHVVFYLDMAGCCIGKVEWSLLGRDDPYWQELDCYKNGPLCVPLYHRRLNIHPMAAMDSSYHPLTEPQTHSMSITVL